jgi:hypothetical protein
MTKKLLALVATVLFVFLMVSSPSWANSEADAAAAAAASAASAATAAATTETKIDLNNTNASTITNTVEGSTASVVTGDNTVTGGTAVIDNSGNTVIGKLPEVNSHGIGAASTPLNEYGRQINQFPISTSVAYICEVTRESYKTFESTITKMNGAKVLKDIKKRTRPRPVILKTFSKQEKVYFTYQLPKGSKGEILGILTYDSKKDKKGDWPLLPQELQMFCALNAMDMGANVVIPLDQFFREHFVPEGSEFSIAGLWNWVGLSGNPTGAAVSPNAGISKQSNQVIGEAGLTFALIHIANADNFNFCGCKEEEKIAPVPVVEELKVIPTPELPARTLADILRDIEENEKDLAGCKVLGLNNLALRVKAARLDWEAYVLTKNKSFLENLDNKKNSAVEHLIMAEKNYMVAKTSVIQPPASSDSVISNAVANKKESAAALYAEALYLTAGYIQEMKGTAAAEKFAQENNLERIPPLGGKGDDVIID